MNQVILVVGRARKVIRLRQNVALRFILFLDVVCVRLIFLLSVNQFVTIWNRGWNISKISSIVKVVQNIVPSCTHDWLVALLVLFFKFVNQVLLHNLNFVFCVVVFVFADEALCLLYFDSIIEMR